MLLAEKKCFVLDMDGTVYVGDIPIQGTINFICQHWNDKAFFFLSNNTSKSPETYVNKLRKMGIPVELSQILSPVSPLVAYLRAQCISRAYLVGNTDFKANLAQCMPTLQHTEDKAQAVILAYDTELTYEKLAKSALLLQNPEVLFLATHPDLVCPSPEGPLPDVGSFLALYAVATGRRPQRIFGKPDPAVLAPVLARYSRESMVMVGDRLSTDKSLAENAGIDFILVLSGEAQRKDLHGHTFLPAAVLEHLGEVEKTA
ncbi:MAG: HAD-IIA family hydrolase [Desulfovibrionaceae bacterium]